MAAYVYYLLCDHGITVTLVIGIIGIVVWGL